MLQVVFSESEWGTLKMATHCRPSSWDDGVIGFIFGDGEKEPTQEEKDQVMARFKAKREKENRRAQPVGGNPGDVEPPRVKGFQILLQEHDHGSAQAYGDGGSGPTAPPLRAPVDSDDHSGHKGYDDADQNIAPFPV